MLKKGAGALTMVLLAAGGARAADWRDGAVPVAANRYVAAPEPYGRPSQLGLVLYPTAREAPGSASTLMDCSTEPVAGQKDLAQPFACYAHSQWPASGTTETFEDSRRRSFEGQ
ncbi:MAG TPA: hypothetical protein VF138_03080 [Caulobacteraceae bacterium]